LPAAWKAGSIRAGLSALGFALFALGLGCSSLQSRVADFDEMFWPQVLRGAAICSACCHRRGWRWARSLKRRCPTPAAYST